MAKRDKEEWAMAEHVMEMFKSMSTEEKLTCRTLRMSLQPDMSIEEVYEVLLAKKKRECR